MFFNSIMENILIQSGFKTIQFKINRNSEWIKGNKLVESGHVIEVKEFMHINSSEIRGKVVRQTSVHEPPYEVYIKLDANRVFQEGTCHCPAGEGGGCKHICAIIYYINVEQEKTKTDRPQQWGKPGPRTTTRQKYAKGQLASQRFTKKRKLTKNVLAAPIKSMPIFKSQSPFVQIIKESLKNEVQKVCESVMAEVLQRVTLKTEEDKFKKLFAQILSNQNIRLFSNKNSIEKLEKRENDFYKNKIKISDNEISDLAFNTIEQSQCGDWVVARKLRISASKRAHQIFRSRNIEKTLKSIIEEKVVLHKNLIYGFKTEKIALEEYCRITTSEVFYTGLVIKKNQPWVCASPDAFIVRNNQIFKIVEIKCPITCKSKPILNANGKFNVKYLCLNAQHEPVLKKSHIYYTQCQLQMYCTGIDFLDLYIYSPMGSQLVAVIFDEEFVKRLVLALEQFYFSYFLPHLTMMSKTGN